MKKALSTIMALTLATSAIQLMSCDSGSETTKAPNPLAACESSESEEFSNQLVTRRWTELAMDPKVVDFDWVPESSCQGTTMVQSQRFTMMNGTVRYRTICTFNLGKLSNCKIVSAAE